MGKKRRTNPIMALLTTVIALVVILVGIFPYLGLREGSFLYAVLGPLYRIVDSHINFFASETLRPFGLVPVVLFCLLNVILAFMGSGLIAFLLRCVAFYSVYLIGTFIQGRPAVFAVTTLFPVFYPFVAMGTFVLSILLLMLVSRIRRGAKAQVQKPETEEPVQQSPVLYEESQQSEVEKSEPEVREESFSLPVYEADPQKSKKALGSLTDVKIPEFQSFPNFLSSSSVSSVDRGVYDVAEREARIKAEEQQRRDAETERLRRIAEEEARARIQAEEERQRLQNMFKPRNLLKRLGEDAQVEKNFPSFTNQAPPMDFGMPEPEEEEEKPISIQTVPVSAGVSTPLSDIPVSQQMPQMQSMQDDDFRAPSSSVFREATAQAEMDEQLESRRRQAEYDRKHLEELQELERQRQQAEEAARKAEEELAKAREEMQRQQELLEQERQARLKPEPEPEPEPESAAEPEEEGISDEDMAANDAKSQSKGPDLDMVSGVAGLKSSYGGNPYLLDKKKFEYKFPPESLLKHYEISAKVYEDLDNDPDGRLIVETFRDFRIETSLVGVQHGPTFTLYELTLAKGIKVTSVLALSENIAMVLSVEDVRILAPIPGKPAIGVEVPNKKRDIIGFDVMMPALKAKFYKIPMVLGKTITGESIVIDVTKTPHLLVAGTTGSGKSVCINGLICSVLYTKTPKEVRMIMVDPKMVELSLYNGIPHLLTPVITEPKKALKAMNFVVEEMERRMALFSSIGAKKIEEYNEKIVEKGLARVKLPYIMVIIDEFADLMLAVGKEVETSIKRITAVARFCGIHLVLATQRPSSDVITGVIKSNIPTQIAFAVSNSTNSRIIIDQVGAEKLLGRGDMLYNNPESRQPARIQGAFIDPEIESIVEFVKTQGEPDYIDESYFEDDDEDEETEDDEAVQGGGSEDLFSKAWKIVSDRNEASASYLQRKLSIGYNRAANLIEQMEEAGYIGPARGSKPREILRYYGSD